MDFASAFKPATYVVVTHEKLSRRALAHKLVAHQKLVPFCAHSIRVVDALIA